MKKFFKEFKDFITRGNVLDMAVGIIVGGAFTAIITALVNNILNPLLAMIPGMSDNGLGALQVVLREVYTDGVLDTSKSVIMDFGVVISAIITFLLTAFVLFLIIKTINTVHNKSKALAEKQKKAIEERKKKGEITAEEAAEEIAEVEEAVVDTAPVAASAVTEELLREIRDLLKAQNENKE